LTFSKECMYDFIEEINKYKKNNKNNKKYFNTKTLDFLFLPIKFVVRFPSHRN
jgi:hypothetical protein